MSEAAEAYKALGVRLLYAAPDRKVKTVLVTSSLDGEGKTSTTANLGVALAVAGKRTVIVSADLRRPALQEYFFSLKRAGLTDVLSGIRKTSEVVGSTGKENLWLLGSGTGAGSVSPLELLSSKSMRDVIAELRSFGDFVLIDMPPVLRRRTSRPSRPSRTPSSSSSIRDEPTGS
jgi:capsular exopolysaccharide synthesis family protein